MHVLLSTKSVQIIFVYTTSVVQFVVIEHTQFIICSSWAKVWIKVCHVVLLYNFCMCIERNTIAQHNILQNLKRFILWIKGLVCLGDCIGYCIIPFLFCPILSFSAKVLAPLETFDNTENGQYRRGLTRVVHTLIKKNQHFAHCQLHGQLLNKPERALNLT